MKFSAEPIENKYFRWLCNKVMKFEGEATPTLSYWKLMKTLHQTEFVWFVPNDDNRVADGVELRTNFLREKRLEDDPRWHAQGCSVLEMLIAFAYRAEFQTGVSFNTWFWRFLENLGLTYYNDAVFDDGINDVGNILETFIWRTYLPNGQGGLFPIQAPRSDQREVEIWYQFSDYLVEQDM